MGSKMKKAQKSIVSDASLGRKDEHVSSEIKGKLGSKINGKGNSKLKMPCLIKTTQEPGKRKENLDRKDKHVSSDNKGRLCNSTSGGEVDCNGKTLSKRNKRCESVRGNGSLYTKGEHVSPKNEGRLGSHRKYGESDPHLMMPSKMKKTHKSIESDGSLDKKGKRVSSEIKGEVGSSRINDKGHPKMKMPCLMKKKKVSGKRQEKPDKKDLHASLENKGRLGNSRSGGEGDCSVKTISTKNKISGSGKSNGSLDRKEERVSSKNEGKLGNCKCDDEGGPHMKVLSKRKKQHKSGNKNQNLHDKDKHGSSENDDRICDNRSCGEGDPNLKMPYKMKKTQKSIKSDGRLDKKGHVSSEIKGKLGSSRISGKGHSKMKIARLIKKVQEAGKRKENLHKNDKHVGSSWTGGEGDCNLKTLSKVNKRCESGKTNGSLVRKEEHVSSKNEGRLRNSTEHDHAWMNLKKPVGSGISGCWIGKLFVSNIEIAKGSNDTIVLEGFYEGRPVAVKRFVQAQGYVASQEIKSLTASDGDPNIVRLHGVEFDQDFVYLALERCACSLDHLIRAHSNSSVKSVFFHDPSSNATVECKMQSGLVEGTMQDVNLWREDGHPSPLLLKLMREVVSGLVHLHRSRIIHRDLKPQNVLITKDLCAKLSDMGISRLLPGDSSSSEYHVTDCGRSGLQASVQVCPVQQTFSIDTFGLGCVLFFCVTGGRYPFGDGLKGHSNIKANKINLSLVEFMPEAADLLACLLSPNPNLRGASSSTVLEFKDETVLPPRHQRLGATESEGGTDSEFLDKMESIAPRLFDEEWNVQIDCEFIKHMRKFKVYQFKRVTDLLRLVRNTFSHYRELPPEIQVTVGTSPEDLDSYFAKRFPRLLIETYKFISKCCRGEDCPPFQEYFNR